MTVPNNNRPVGTYNLVLGLSIIALVIAVIALVLEVFTG